MRKLTVLIAAIAASVSLPVHAGTISVATPTPFVSSPFDVVVRATNLFAGRDPATDGIISYGFNVSVTNPAVLTFLGATSGPLFDAVTAEPGTNVFGAASGFGIFSPVVEPLLLVTLHFGVRASGVSDIVLSSDLSNAFQGLQYLNPPFSESITSRLAIVVVPEPATLALAGAALAALIMLRQRRSLE